MMSEDATSLERLHDIVVPTAVPFWPPAPGWYVLLAALACLGAIGIYQFWSHWKANAYRRAALRELNQATSASAIAEILKRSALAIAPRAAIAALTESQWPQWLSSRAEEPMPEQVAEQLSRAIYQKSASVEELSALRSYAAYWIRSHRRSNHPDVSHTAGLH